VLSTFATIPMAMRPHDIFGFGILEDSAGNVVAPRKGLVFDKVGNQLGDISSWTGDFLVFTSTSVFKMAVTKDSIIQSCFDGNGPSGANPISYTPPFGFQDGSGLAIAPDGTLYFGQGNTTPSTIYKVSPVGAPPYTAQMLASVPMQVLNVSIDAGGSALYLSGSGDFDTVWKINTATGAKVVYGCDARSTRKCGDTN
jgi:hypothetical protein